MHANQYTLKEDSNPFSSWSRDRNKALASIKHLYNSHKGGSSQTRDNSEKKLNLLMEFKNACNVPKLGNKKLKSY